MDEEERRLWSAYDVAAKKLASGKAGGSGGLESEFAKAYQRLVMAGHAQQLKKKFRQR